MEGAGVLVNFAYAWKLLYAERVFTSGGPLTSPAFPLASRPDGNDLRPVAFQRGAGLILPESGVDLRCRGIGVIQNLTDQRQRRAVLREPRADGPPQVMQMYVL